MAVWGAKQDSAVAEGALTWTDVLEELARYGVRVLTGQFDYKVVSSIKAGRETGIEINTVA